MNQQLQQVVQTLRQSHELDVLDFDTTFLAESLARRLAASSETPFPTYRQRLAEDRAEAEAFLHSLNINHSEFFRNPLTFALLEQMVLPGLSETKKASPAREVRVWSAGCAAGQEIFSVAMLLEDLAVARERPAPARMFATDVDPEALSAAHQGEFTEAAVRNVRQRHLCDYFSMKDGSYTVQRQLRDRVAFSLYDLRDEHSVCPPASLYGDFDLILCCNLLYYYRPEIRRRLLDKLCRALSPGGYFVTGEAERDLVVKHGGWRAVAPPEAIFQRQKLSR